MNKYYKKAEQFVKESFVKTGKKHEMPHFERTVYWLLKLKPDADEALKIAAIAHDIERAFREKDMFIKKKRDTLKMNFFDPMKNEERKLWLSS